jgi:hypothetical protein
LHDEFRDDVVGNYHEDGISHWFLNANRHAGGCRSIIPASGWKSNHQSYQSLFLSPSLISPGNHGIHVTDQPTMDEYRPWIQMLNGLCPKNIRLWNDSHCCDDQKLNSFEVELFFDAGDNLDGFSFNHAKLFQILNGLARLWWSNLCNNFVQVSAPRENWPHAKFNCPSVWEITWWDYRPTISSFFRCQMAWVSKIASDWNKSDCCDDQGCMIQLW